MLINKKYIWACIAAACILCLLQITGNMLLILACLISYLAILAIACVHDFTLPILLFFLPWSPIMKLYPGSFSFFTFGLVLICIISAIKRKFCFRAYHLVAGILMLFLTLLSKLLDGSGLSFDYIAFIMLIVLFPVVKEETSAGKYDFYQVVSFFSLGIIIAVICAMIFAKYPNISEYIRVDQYLTVTRRSGFYGDPNFYTAQITAALSGAICLLLQEKKRGMLIWLGIASVTLMYCGMLSGSKSFVLVAACVVLLWVIAFLRLRGRMGLKVILLISLILVAVYIASSAMLKGLVDVFLTRFSNVKDLDSFTTGRIELWLMYIEEILGDIKVFFLGRGFTNVNVNDRASHNTILQSIYQFGMLGVPVLIYWMVNFSKDVFDRRAIIAWPSLNVLIVSVGTYLPWLALDMLFFDDFFLMQWYLFIALQQEIEKHKRKIL